MGLVQGVFFRKYAFDKAIELQLNGYVKNERDGSVSIHCEGPELQVNQLIQWCQSGSPLSKVEQVQVMESNSLHCKDFVIRKD